MSSLCDFYELLFGIKKDFDIEAPNTGLGYIELDVLVRLKTAERDW